MSRMPGRAKDVQLDGARIFLVEDDYLLLLDLEAILEAAGGRIVGRHRGLAEALAAAEHVDIDVAILDVQLGRHLITPVAQLLAERRIPFLFYTGQVGTDPVLAEWRGCRVISKPAFPRVIVSAVAELLAK